MRARELRKSSPDAEAKLWLALRNRQLDGYKFRRQHPVGPFFADFACVQAGLIVELDGGQHFEPEVAIADARRTTVLNARGFEVIRFTDHEALLERTAVMTRILEWLHANRPHPSPLPRAGEGATPRTSP